MIDAFWICVARQNWVPWEVMAWKVDLILIIWKVLITRTVACVLLNAGTVNMLLLVDNRLMWMAPSCPEKGFCKINEFQSHFARVNIPPVKHSAAFYMLEKSCENALSEFLLLKEIF